MSSAMNLIDRAFSPEFYDQWETLPVDQRETARRKLLAEYIEHAATHVEFYRDRLAGINLNDTHPLKSVPVLESADLRQLLPPASDQLIALPEQPYTVFQSGGTTGFPKTSLFTGAEVDALDLPNARGFYALGLNRQDRVANLFAVGGLYMTFVHINRMLQHYGCMNFPFSNQTNSEFIATLTNLFKINVFTGITSVVLDCLRHFAASEHENPRIEKVFYGGEHIYDSDREFLRREFGTSIIAAPGYGTVDTWYIGYQCKMCPPGVFHAHDDQTYIEIVDEESGSHAEPEAAGMMYATPFPRRLTPIVRYRVGDRAFWLKDSCACGRTTPRFKLLGRGDEVLRIGYDFVDYAFIQTCVSSVTQLCGSVQIEKKRREGRDEMIIRVEATDCSNQKSLAEQLSAIIIKQRPSLQDFIKKGTVWPLKIEILPIGSIERNVRTGKLKRVIDLE